MQVDQSSFDELLETSQDIQSDAMKSTKESLEKLVDVGREQRAQGGLDLDQSRATAAASQAGVRKGLVGGGAVAATAFGGVLLGMMASPAFAMSSADVQMLQTSAAIENLAVETYKTALGLPYIGGASANKVITAFAKTTMAQHMDHAMAFNSAVKSLGGKEQTKPDPKYVPVVKAAVKAIGKDSPSAGALAVVKLAMTLENVAAETYVNNCSVLKDSNAKKITASIMGVEAQHVAVLLAVQALLKGHAPQLIALSPTVVTKLPAAAGSVGFPNSFYPTSMASKAKEGAVS